MSANSGRATRVAGASAAAPASAQIRMAIYPERPVVLRPGFFLATPGFAAVIRAARGAGTVAFRWSSSLRIPLTPVGLNAAGLGTSGSAWKVPPELRELRDGQRSSVPSS